jgi:protoporphyrinogen oxidase
LFAQNAQDFFRAKKIEQVYIDEFVTGLARYDFGQDTGIHALADVMSLIGTGMRGQNYVVKGGNHSLCQALLEAAEAEVKLETAARRITRRSATDGTADRYEIETDQGERDIFDAVIIATPLELADLTFHDIDLPESASIRRTFQTIYTTFVLGELNPDYFGLHSQKDLPNFIMTREDEMIPFLSISDVGQLANSATKLYKIFSRAAPDDSLLEALFDDHEATEQVTWQAWPLLTPAAALPPFTLAEGLYYVNAIESLVPTMEAAAIAGRNVINLLDEELLEPVDDEE